MCSTKEPKSRRGTADGVGGIEDDRGSGHQVSMDASNGKRCDRKGIADRLADGLKSACSAGRDALDANDRDPLEPGSLSLQAAVQLGL